MVHSFTSFQCRDYTDLSTYNASFSAGTCTYSQIFDSTISKLMPKKSTLAHKCLVESFLNGQNRKLLSGVCVKLAILLSENLKYLRISFNQLMINN